MTRNQQQNISGSVVNTTLFRERIRIYSFKRVLKVSFTVYFIEGLVICDTFPVSSMPMIIFQTEPVF